MMQVFLGFVVQCNSGVLMLATLDTHPERAIQRFVSLREGGNVPIGPALSDWRLHWSRQGYRVLMFNCVELTTWVDKGLKEADNVEDDVDA